jgi:two-component system, LytTR family, response regulator
MNQLTIYASRGRVVVPSNDIMYLESDCNYTKVYSSDKSKIVSSFTLKVLEKRITDETFLRINRGLSINIKYMSHLCFIDNLTHVMLSNGKTLPVSRRRSKAMWENPGFKQFIN